MSLHLPTKCRRIQQQESKKEREEGGRNENSQGNEQSNWERETVGTRLDGARGIKLMQGRERDQAVDVEVQWSNADVSRPLCEGVNNANLLAQLFSEQRFPSCRISYWWWEMTAMVVRVWNIWRKVFDQHLNAGRAKIKWNLKVLSKSV